MNVMGRKERNERKERVQRCFRIAGDWLRPRVDRIHRDWRVNARVRLANRYARKHPRRVFISLSAILMLVFAANILLALMTGKGKESSVPPDFINVSEVYAKMADLKERQKVIESEKLELARYTMSLMERVDSLSRLEDMTHEDSLELAASGKAAMEAYSLMGLKGRAGEGKRNERVEEFMLH